MSTSAALIRACWFRRRTGDGNNICVEIVAGGQSKGSVCTLELSRQLGVKWDSAWLMRQKLAEVMLEAEKPRKINGRIEMDDAVLGGAQRREEGGKPGRTRPSSRSACATQLRIVCPHSLATVATPQ